MSHKINNILAHAKKADRSLARQLRKAAVEATLEMAKEASSTNEQHGIFQNMQGGSQDYPTREQSTHQRGGSNGGVNKYDTGPKHEKSKISYPEAPRTLSTRYSPDRVGVQAPTKEGIQIDPLTGKEYNWNEGFTTETGEKFPGGSVDQQTDIYFEY
jgi:hypothetical protein